MLDPITLLFAAAFASVFIFGLGLDLGFKIGRAVEKRIAVTFQGTGGPTP